MSGQNEKCVELNLLARLTDRGEIADEWLEGQGWEPTGAGRQKDFGKFVRIIFEDLESPPLLMLFEYRDGKCIDDDFIELPGSMNRGQLLCLIRSLGGESAIKE